MIKAMHLPKLLHHYSLPRVALLLLLLLLVGVGAVPSYITGKWSWTAPPQVTNINRLKDLHKSGVTVPGWKTNSQQVLSMGGHKWLRQDIQKDANTKGILFLLNQTDGKNQPQVEWMDMDGYWRWKTDSHGWIEFQLDRDDLGTVGTEQNAEESVRVKARFFRAWTQQQTYAIAQWYAWPTGGDPAPLSWFWRDRLAQLQGKRLPWVALSVIIPIEPLGDLEKVKPLAESLSKNVQGALIQGQFARMKESK